ncbi:MAG: Arm DNA-binding domain-containing protein [Novosphingobium sp.]
MGNLTANMLRGSLEPGRHHDGDGLFLNVTPTGARSLICRVQKNGRRRDIGLGSAKKVSLAQSSKRASSAPCANVVTARPSSLGKNLQD